MNFLIYFSEKDCKECQDRENCKLNLVGILGLNTNLLTAIVTQRESIRTLRTIFC
jgi:hypothetical protein